MPEYLDAIVRHGQECLEDQEDLSKIAQQRHFDRIERRASKRALQVLIGVCIGVAKYR